MLLFFRVANKHIYFEDDEGGVEEKINEDTSEETHDINLKREGDQLADAPPCKKSIVCQADPVEM